MFSASATLNARTQDVVADQALSELSSAVVDAILHQVEDRTIYSFEQLTHWYYHTGQVTITEVPEGYRVSIIDDDAHSDTLLIDNL